MTNNLRLTILSLLVAPLCSALLADEPSADAAALFAQLDVNKDGQIGADEVPQ